MAAFQDRRSAAASQVRRVVDEILQIAHSEHAAATVSGGGKPHVAITKNVPDFNDTYFRSMLSGIEYAAHGYFDQGREAAGHTDWFLKGRLIDVTIRGTKGLP